MKIKLKTATNDEINARAFELANEIHKIMKDNITMQEIIMAFSFTMARCFIALDAQLDEGKDIKPISDACDAFKAMTVGYLTKMHDYK